MKRKRYHRSYTLTPLGWAMADGLRSLLGPCPCQGCGVPLYWRGLAIGWCEAHVTSNHICR